MKILGFKAENIKRVNVVEITPAGNLDRDHRQEQARDKTFGARRHRGRALDTNKSIRGERRLRAGAEGRHYVRRRTVGVLHRQPSKFTRRDDESVAITLTVANQDGAKYGSPNELLKGFLGQFTFDPLAFVDMKPREQVLAFRSLVSGYDFAEAERMNKQDYDERTEVNRKLKDALTLSDEIMIPEATPAERMSLSDLMDELDAAMAHNASIDSANMEGRQKRDLLARLVGSILEKEAEVEAILKSVELKREEIASDRKRFSDLEADLAARPAAPDRVDVDAIREKISQSEQVNLDVAQRERKARLQAEAREAKKASDQLTAAIEARKKEAADAIRSADLGIPGLELTEDQILLNGQPFEQASDAEQLRLSVAVAGAMNPKLRVVRVRDGSRLDTEAMAEITRYAEENDLQIWIETVESSRASAIVIKDGVVSED